MRAAHLCMVFLLSSPASAGIAAIDLFAKNSGAPPPPAFTFPTPQKIVFRGYEMEPEVRAFVTGLAGGMAGSSVSLLLHPIDTLKTLSQTTGGRASPNILAAARSLIREKGFYHTLYAGSRTVALGSFFSSFLYFSTYESVREFWSAHVPAAVKSLSPSLAAVTGNAVSSLLFVPKEVVKQRCQVTVDCCKTAPQSSCHSPRVHGRADRPPAARPDGAGTDAQHRPEGGRGCAVQRILRNAAAKRSRVGVSRQPPLCIPQAANGMPIGVRLASRQPQSPAVSGHPR